MRIDADSVAVFVGDLGISHDDMIMAKNLYIRLYKIYGIDLWLYV